MNCRLISLLCAILVAAEAARPDTGLAVDPATQASFEFNPALDPETPDIPLDDPLLARQVAGYQPEGIHVTPWQQTEEGWTVLVSWQTGEPIWVKSGTPFEPHDPSQVAAAVEFGPAPGQLTRSATGNTSLVYTNIYNDTAWSEGHSYSSPVLHHVLVPGLAPGERVFYRVGNPQDGFSEERSFRVPGGMGDFPLRIGVIGDLGGSLNATQTRGLLLDHEPHIVLLAGDLPYADRYCSNGTFLNYQTVFCFGDSDQRRWDAWARMHEELFATIPVLHCPGNHEPEVLLAQGNITFQAYNTRYPLPQDPSRIQTSPNWANTFLNSSNLQQWANADKVQPNNSYYSMDVQGVHLVSLSQFVPYGEDSAQYRWLVGDLAAVDRGRTPWLVVMFHEPPYHSYNYHYKEVEEFRLIYEPLFYEAGVDIVIQGHVHAAERTLPMYNYTVDPCGPMYLVMGNAGNVEGVPVLDDSIYPKPLDTPVFIDQAQPDFCNDTRRFNPYQSPIPLLLPTTVAGKQLVTFQGGQFCPSRQPEWSAYREPSFGHGILTILNATHASWEYFRNQDSNAFAADSVIIAKTASDCKALL